MVKTIRQFLKIVKEDSKQLYSFTFHFACFMLASTLGFYLADWEGLKNTPDMNMAFYQAAFWTSAAFSLIGSIFLAMYNVVRYNTRKNENKDKDS